jgi:hypothetical protein
LCFFPLRQNDFLTNKTDTLGTGNLPYPVLSGIIPGLGFTDELNNFTDLNSVLVAIAMLIPLIVLNLQIPSERGTVLYTNHSKWWSHNRHQNGFKM